MLYGEVLVFLHLINERRVSQVDWARNQPTLQSCQVIEAQLGGGLQIVFPTADSKSAEKQVWNDDDAAKGSKRQRRVFQQPPGKFDTEIGVNSLDDTVNESFYPLLKT